MNTPVIIRVKVKKCKHKLAMNHWGYTRHLRSKVSVDWTSPTTVIRRQRRRSNPYWCLTSRIRKKGLVFHCWYFHRIFFYFVWEIYCSTQTVCGYATQVFFGVGQNFIYHRDSTARLGTFVYGFRKYFSYGYPAGMQLNPTSGTIWHSHWLMLVFSTPWIFHRLTIPVL